ncbi:5'-nucleotidase [Alicyclobacillus sp. SO9]|uniref:5'-nucleotidase n=1 Tax=Alicyclobacillus sp. SO9 TaxID=2665646 RepID=UPI0018E83D84|nr:5'-nucleotidase [Alicyclobacillus sp. SO9]QQE77285.1 5'-nucleotidase [Alicyclobacillus sp. SO9]
MMSLDLSDTLVVGISGTALYNLDDIDSRFRELSASDPDSAIEIYRKEMSETEEIPLEHGAGHPLVRALLNLNRHQSENESPLVEVVIMSRNSPETGLRILNSIRHDGLSITRSAFTAGESVVDYLDAFDVDLFLTTNVEDAQRVIDSRVCAAAVLSKLPEHIDNLSDDQVRIAFDGDAVLFDEQSELVYKTKGIEAFRTIEDESKEIPLQEGPYAVLLKKLAQLQDRLPGRIEYSPVRIALVTARNSPAEIRVIKTLRAWGVYVDECFFLGGLEKTKVLRAFRPHIFFDDQDIHLDKAAEFVPSGKVLYATDSPLAQEGE